MNSAPTLDDQIRAVERAASGLASADIRGQTRALIAAAATLHEERARRMTASEALDKRMLSDARIGAALDRARTP